jgi:Virulence factor membrane-bound polymerase, C-terminal/O-Antigen ligase
MRTLLIAIGLAGLLLGWGMPNHYPLWTTFQCEFASAAGIGSLFAGLLIPSIASSKLKSPNYSLRIPLASKTWLVVALIPALQFATGRLDFHGDLVLGALYFAGAGLAIYVGHLWVVQESAATALRGIFLTVLIAAIGSGGLAFWQWMRLPHPGWWAMELINSRPYGNFAQPNLFGLLMVMGIVSASALFEMRVLQHRFSYWLVLLFLGGSMLVSESRASLFAAISLAGLWFASQSRVPTRLRWYEVLLALILGAVVHGALVHIEELLYLRATATRSILEVGPREAIWLHFWAAIQAHPWAGYGFNQGVAALREVADQVQPSRNSVYAHNVVLDLMVWFGIPLGAAMTAALLAWMASWLRKTADPVLMAQRHWVFAFWLALLVQSLLEFPFAHAFFLLPAALLAGAVTGPPSLGASTSPRPRFVASPAAIALAAVAAVLLGLTTWDYLQFETEFRANRFDKGNFATPAVHEPRSGPVMLDQLDLLNRSAHYEIRRGMPPAEIESLGHLARRFHLLPTRFEYAKALALNGRMPEANVELRMIRSVYHPLLWAQIERDWLAWLARERLEIKPLG